MVSQPNMKGKTEKKISSKVLERWCAVPSTSDPEMENVFAFSRCYYAVKLWMQPTPFG